MSEIEKFTTAFQLVNKYEEYKLIRAWGIIIIVIGVARFLLGWATSSFLLYFSDFNLHVSIAIRAFQAIFSLFLIACLALFTIYTYLSLKKTVIKDNELVSSRFVYFGLALAVLFLLTFVINIPGDFYWEEVLGVFISYILLRKGISSSDFKEQLYLGFTLLGISIFEFLWRIIMAVLIVFSGLLDIDNPAPANPWLIPLSVISYLIISVIFMVPYVISGLYSIRKSSQILEKSSIATNY